MKLKLRIDPDDLLIFGVLNINRLVNIQSTLK